MRIQSYVPSHQPELPSHLRNSVNGEKVVSSPREKALYYELQDGFGSEAAKPLKVFVPTADAKVNDVGPAGYWVDTFEKK